MDLSKSIGSPQLIYKNFIIFLDQKTKNQKMKIFHEGVVLAMFVQRPKFGSGRLLDKFFFQFSSRFTIVTQGKNHFSKVFQCVITLV